MECDVDERFEVPCFGLFEDTREEYALYHCDKDNIH